MSRIKPSLPTDPSPSPLPAPTSTKSFWHSDPSALLTAHRSTRNLPEEADVVIIGSGMTGASAAHHLLNDASTSGDDIGCERKGKRSSVVMLEAREACWGATGRNGGHCQPLLLEHPHNPSIPAFELRNFHALHNLTQSKAIADAEFVPQPGVRAMYSLSNLHEMELALHTLQTTAPEMAKLCRITRDEAELAKLRVPGALGALITDVAARMWPYQLVARIMEDLLTANSLPGGTFNLQTLTPVTSLSRSSGHDWIVQTERGAITAKKVILATNAYTSHLLPFLAPLIVPVRGQMSALRPLTSLAGPNRLKTSFGFAGDGIDDYLIQRPNETGGHLMFGGGRQCLPCVGEADDSVIDPETAKYLRKRLIDALGLPEGETAGRQLYNLEGEVREKRMWKEGTKPLACDYCFARRIRCSGPSSNPSSPNTPADTRCLNCIRFGQGTCGSFAHPRPSSSANTAATGPGARELSATHEWTGIMGFSRDDLPWVGQVPASLLPDDAVSATAGEGDETGVFIAAGYTGHGMPNTWLCGAAVALMVCGAGKAEIERRTGLPEEYLISEERVARALEQESVQARDWAEMDRARGRSERPASGYA